jgi:hypothetical protein
LNQIPSSALCSQTFSAYVFDSYSCHMPRQSHPTGVD